MPTARLSKHMVYERTNRLELLSEYLGYSDKVLLETYDKNHTARIRIFSTGVCHVVDLYEEYVITGYALNIKQATAIWYNSTGNRMPSQLYKRITKNMERHPEFYNIK